MAYFFMYIWCLFSFFSYFIVKNYSRHLELLDMNASEILSVVPQLYIRFRANVPGLAPFGVHVIPSHIFYIP